MPRLYNSEVPDDRGILIHWGRTYDHTKGCLIPEVVPGKDCVWTSSDKKSKDDHPSKRKLEEEIQPFLNAKGYENVKLHSFEPLTAAEKQQISFNNGPRPLLTNRALGLSQMS